MVGDSYGRIRGDDGAAWIDSPDTAVRRGDGLYYQTAWIQDTDAAGNPVMLTREQWEAATKTMRPDGRPVAEGFVGGNGTSLLENPWVIGGVAIACVLAIGWKR